MSIVYFQSTDNSTKVRMDCETNITISQTNRTSQYSIMSGASASDGFIEGNKIVNVQGIVTYSKTKSQTGYPDPSEFQSLIDEAITNKSRFTLHSDEGSTYKLLPLITNCVIKSYNYKIDKYLDTLTASIQFESQFVTDAAVEGELEPEVKTGNESLSSLNEGNGNKVSKTSEDSTTTSKVIDIAESISGVDLSSFTGN